MRILVTGGLGYIGAHIVATLLNNPTVEHIFIIDNLINSHEEKLNAFRDLGQVEKLTFYKSDLQNLGELNRIFAHSKPDFVIHLAGLKSVAQSTRWPIEYYNNNMLTTMNLLTAMRENNIYNLIFSSSATVYDPTAPTPFTEDSPTGKGLTNPYARTKIFIEEYLKDIYMSDPKSWNISILRYFNPIGAAHPILKEQNKPLNPEAPSRPNNLYPIVLQVTEGKRPFLEIFGTDYPTPDGTAIRDYIHVQDLAEGHVAVAEKHKSAGYHVYNLGTGRGTSVKEFVDTFNVVNHTSLLVKNTQRRPGDIAISVADVSKAETILGWKAKRSLAESLKVE
jgi:UDP-glucose 4-epimerase